MNSRVSILLVTAAILIAVLVPSGVGQGYMNTPGIHSDAQREGWGRTVALPWVGWRNTWRNAFSTPQSAEYQWFWRAELLAVVIGVTLLVLLLVQRRWGEATYIGASTLLMTISTAFESGIRTTLVWFPLYLLLARLAQGRPWLRSALLWVSTPLMAVFAVAFTRGVWIG